MRIILFSLFIFGSPSFVYSKPLENKEWIKCNKDKDCIVAGHACGQAYAVNMKFQDEFESFLGASPFECNQPPPFQLFKATCKKSICMVLELKK